jgi:hypothetical protein
MGKVTLRFPKSAGFQKIQKSLAQKTRIKNGISKTTTAFSTFDKKLP